MKKLFCVLILFGIYNALMYAQKDNATSNIYAGFGPAGICSPYISTQENNFECNISNISLGLEWGVKGLLTLHELQYSMGEATYSDNLQYSMGKSKPYNGKTGSLGAKSITYMFMIGYSLNKGKRLQFPVYAGVGAGLIDMSDGFEEGGLMYGAKVMVKFYISRRFGVYADFRTQSNIGSLSAAKWAHPFLEAGICIGLK